MRKRVQSGAALLVGGIAGYAVAAENLLEKYLPLSAAPEHHRVILENDTVRVLDVRIPPGDTVPAHQHDLPSIFITLSPADLVLRSLSGENVRDVRRTRDAHAEPQVEWRDPAPAPRIVSNIDTVELRALRIELKSR
ncbi:MAG: hypothetical protein QNK04_27250 [Myxococcota bacterium]|nr:hypothetical protein [Myxococcota bacterium]